MSQAMENRKGRMLIGTVVSDKNDKTIEMCIRDRNKAFEKPLAGHSQDTRKAPGDIPGAFLASGKIKI